MVAGGYVRQWGSCGLFLTIVCFSQAAVGAPNDAPAGASPTCALIDFDRSPLATVLEAKLLADVEATWLERNAIDEVMKEQELQALFTPEAGAQRAALGKLLKADVLVLVRDAPPPPPDKSANASAGEKPVKAIELAVTETRRGLRLCSRSVPRSDDAETDADTLVQLVREALGRFAQQVTEIYAVPPFVSRDLGYEHDYLRGAYASLLEQVLLDRPGALVVELAEAQSLAKEVALTDPGARLTRNVPFYLLGEYRNEGAGDNRRVRLSLKLMRGEQPLDGRSLDRVAADEAATVLQKLARELVDKAAGKKQAAVSPVAEIEALNRREKLFLRLGQWEDALALAEASLLLKSDQEPLLVDAILALTALCDQNWNIYPIDIDRMRLAASYNRRGVQHLERFAALGGLPQTYDERGVGGFVSRLLGVTLNDQVNPGYTPERNELIRELRAFRQRALRRLIPQAARANWKHEEFLLERLLGYESSLERRFEIAFDVILSVKDFDGAKARVIAYSWQIHTFHEHFAERHELYEAFYDRLAQLPNEQVQKAAEQLRRQMALYVKDYNRQRAEEQARRLAEAEARAKATPVAGIREVDFAWEDGSGAKGRFKSFGGCLPIPGDIDVIWGDGLYLMKQPGKLKRVYKSPDTFGIDTLVANSGHAHICYDGKFVWAAFASHRDKPPFLVALDPERETCCEFTSVDGLPVSPRTADGVNQRQFIAVAPLAPGRVCLAGYFGQTWLAVGDFDGSSGKSVKVFHEAREAWNRTTQQQFSDIHLAFQPTYMLRLSEADGGVRRPRVLLGRGEVDHACPPLVIDVETLAVKTAAVGVQFPPQIPSSDTKNAVHDDGIYTVRPPKFGAQPALCRAELPQLEFKPVMQNVPPGFVTFVGDQVHIIGHEWWTGRIADGKLRCLAQTLPWWYGFGWYVAGRAPDPPKTDDLPELRRVFRSNHYGILVERAWSPLHPETTFEARELIAAAR